MEALHGIVAAAGFAALLAIPSHPPMWGDHAQLEEATQSGTAAEVAPEPERKALDTWLAWGFDGLSPDHPDTDDLTADASHVREGTLDH